MPKSVKIFIAEDSEENASHNSHFRAPQAIKGLILFILIIVICFLPTKIFGFFATPDNHIYSMPFGIQGSNPGVLPLTSGGFNPDALQTEPSQNFLPEDFSGTSSPNNLNSNNKESPKKISLATFVVWPLIIFFFVVFFLALIFLVIRSIHAGNKN